MKKFVIASMFALAAVSASAMEVGLTAARDYAGDGRNAAGLAVSQKFGAWGLEAAFDRSSVGNNDLNRYSLVGSRDLVTVAGVTVAAKAGAAYLDNQVGNDGTALVAGVGARVPVPFLGKAALTVDFTRQYGQERVKELNGNRVTVGLRYAF